MARQVQLANEQGLKGVRWTFSEDTATAYYRALFQKHFMKEYNSGFIEIYHVPFAGQ
jgi:hypothetical protein